MKRNSRERELKKMMEEAPVVSSAQAKKAEEKEGIHAPKVSLDRADIVHSHPGFFLKMYMKDANLGGVELGHIMGCKSQKISEIRSEKRNVTKEVAAQLSEVFSFTTIDFWLTLQNNFEVSEERKALRKMKEKDIEESRYRRDQVKKGGFASGE